MMLRQAIKYGLYPSLLTLTIGFIIYTIHYDWDLKTAFTWLAFGRFSLLFAVEFCLPAKQQWKMTWSSFWRDLKYALVTLTVSRAIRFLIVLFALDLASVNQKGLLADSNLFIGFLFTALSAEFLQYWFHRFCHEGKGKIGSWFWRIHAAHHLPDKVYLVMHGVMHPFNQIISFALIQLALVGLGASAQSLFMVNALMGFHGLISHFNVDIRAGWFNYIFIGTELHRYHHSANLEESKNYGGFLTVWDIVFGTFYYRPNQLPERLGVVDPNQYPNSNDLWKVLTLPFKSRT